MGSVHQNRKFNLQKRSICSQHLSCLFYKFPQLRACCSSVWEICLVPQWCHAPQADSCSWLPAGLLSAGRYHKPSTTSVQWKHHSKPSSFPVSPNPNPLLVRRVLTFSAMVQRQQLSVHFSEPPTPCWLLQLAQFRQAFCGDSVNVCCCSWNMHYCRKSDVRLGKR